MSMGIIIGLMVLGIGSGMMALGAYLLYQSFQDEEGWFTSPVVARVIGIVLLLLGLSMLCVPVLLIAYFMVV